MIPFVDLKQQYISIKDEIDNAISNVIDTSSFIGGESIKRFENNFASYLGINHCIGCANGTDSIEILLKTLGIGKDDEVIIPAISWIATSEAVSAVGATPIFVDVDDAYYTIDCKKITSAITNKTKAIIPVHLYGQAVDMDALLAIAKEYNLKVIEDCAQAHGAEWNGKKVGTFGDCASFSFFPGKNLGAFGDAGCMVTNNPQIAELARMIANHGQQGKHNHVIEGRNSRLDTIHAAVLDVKLQYLSQWNEMRINAASEYERLLKSTNITIPQRIPNSKHVFHLYVIQTDKREFIQKKLEEKEIQTAIHYPKALPFLQCYNDRNFTKNDFPVAFNLQDNILSLPMFPGITHAQIKEICNVINENI
jgi:dTDP-4-amino-4,6-dideoxygalactose transaminase